MSTSLLSEREGRLLRLTLNRPEKRNALNLELCQALADACDAADADPGVGAILLEANGKSFCSGMDLKEVLGVDSAAINTAHERLFSVGVRLNKPLVAAVQGAALAGGTGLVAACHVVVAAEDAQFGLTEVRIGLWPFVVLRGVIQAVGERRALEWSLTGRICGAREAAECGLVHQVVPRGELQAHARQVAAALAASSPAVLRSGLTSFRLIRGLSWEQAGRVCRSLRDENFETPDCQEGIRAFLEKRPPRWPSLEP
ncbi:MAG TPA: enoyl-CoA hydratase-related protein [Bryobacteraceae bacterium]|nr:enoyl-CoA hydratase-related protein [Bryobacteraceae bacterium]